MLQLLVYVFGLAVRLQVVGSGGVELYTKLLAEFLSEVHYKLQSPIRYISVGEAVELPDIPPVQVCSADGRAGGVSHYKVCSFAIQVHHHHDGIVNMGIGELYNEIHQGNAPLLCGNREEMALGLGLEAEITCTSVGTNISRHLGPLVVPGY
ncbi:hypothetical protein J132_04653 [Termitomyces sp. J132]|nr:hypothetical protein J132_04653 [Termitomyces sp. J132]